MADRLSRPSSPYLEPPEKNVELEDPGAQGSASNSDDEHFSDASEGRRGNGRTSPVPRTRVEKVDDIPRHGEVPGTPAYDKRELDAVPDEIEVVPEGTRSRSHSALRLQDRPITPGGTPIPRTIVEKVDTSSPSHGEVPGTAAYERRKADAVPDLVLNASRHNLPAPEPRSPGMDVTTMIPETVVSRVESLPDAVATPRRRAHRRSTSDAEPDLTEQVTDSPSKPSTPLLQLDLRERLTNSEPPVSLSISLADSHDNQGKQASSGDADEPRVGDGDDEGFRAHARSEQPLPPVTAEDEAEFDDFDDFADEQHAAGDHDDFGDFDDEFAEPEAEPPDGGLEQPSALSQQPLAVTSVPPLVDFDKFKSLPDLLHAIDSDLDKLFPASKDVRSLPPVEPIDDASAIFSSERSLSLWSQLVATPPLQPQNWVKSRIRRLFLVSLGVPVDLDEILPASKQKKLVLPSINLDNTDHTRRSRGIHSAHSAARSSSQVGQRRSKDGAGGAGAQSGSDSARNSGQLSRSKTTSRRRDRSSTPPPDLDLLAVRRLCSTTDAALDGMTGEEVQAHVVELEQATLRASAVLEYWLKRRDGLVSEKEAFEGVIENLVNHARRVRK